MSQLPGIVRPFHLDRMEDESGVSGTGIVAQGVELANGLCVMWWLRPPYSIQTYATIAGLEQIHGHGGKTEVRNGWGVPPVEGPWPK